MQESQEQRDHWYHRAVDGNPCFWERYSLCHSSCLPGRVCPAWQQEQPLGFSKTLTQKNPDGVCWLPSSLCPWQFPALQIVGVSTLHCQGSWRTVELFLKLPSCAQPQCVTLPDFLRMPSLESKALLAEMQELGPRWSLALNSQHGFSMAKIPQLFQQCCCCVQGHTTNKVWRLEQSLITPADTTGKHGKATGMVCSLTQGF